MKFLHFSNSSVPIFIKASASHPAPLCGSSFISYESAPLMKRFVISALCASTHAQLTNHFMAELLFILKLVRLVSCNHILNLLARIKQIADGGIMIQSIDQIGNIFTQITVDIPVSFK